MKTPYIFVTVGTTNFDDLIHVIDSTEFCAWAKAKGYAGILVQKGNGKYEPGTGSEGVPIEHYSFKPSLHDDMAGAALVVSHAGSGSIMESLELGKPTVVVVNTSLMDNHQLELANKLHQLGKVTISNGPQNFLAAIADLPSFSSSSSSSAGSSTKAQGKNNKSTEEEEEQHDHHHFDNVFEEICAGNPQKRILSVMGSGGHTTEMVRMLSDLDFEKHGERAYVLAETDRISPGKVDTLEARKNNVGQHTVVKVPRSREVGQSYLTSILTTFVAFFYSFAAVWRFMPDVVVCNGPGTCVPICVAARIIRLLCWKDIRIVYVESVARVKSLSLSGKILRFVADCFIVQWPELKERYPKSTLKNFFFGL